jgi:hypothetical protein
VNDGARLGAGDAFFTISVNHCSAFGSGFVTSIGTLFCVGDEGSMAAIAGEGALGKVSVIVVTCEELTATRLLNLDGTNDLSVADDCRNGVAVPTGIDEFNGRYGVTIEVGHEGGDGILCAVLDEFIIPFANFSKFKKFSVSFDSMDNP